jgi:WD40 repeat protein
MESTSAKKIFIFIIKVAIGSDSGTIKVYNETSFALIKSFQAHSGGILRIKQSPFNNGQYVATCSADKTLKIWNSTNNAWSLIRTFTNHNNQVRSLEFLGPNTMASCGLDLTIRIWIISSGQIQKTLNLFLNGVYSLKLLSNGIHLAAGLGNGNINIYNVNTGSLVSTLKGHTSIVYDLALINNDLLASASADFKVRVWNLTTTTTKFILNGHTDVVKGLKQISSSILASAGSLDKKIIFWNTTSGSLIRTLSNHTSYIYWSLDLLGNGQILVSGSGDQTIKFWNITSGQVLNSLKTSSNIYALSTLDRPAIISKSLMFI